MTINTTDIKNRRGAAIAIVAVAILLCTLDIKFPIFDKLFFNARDGFSTYLGVFVLFFPSIFYAGKYLDRKNVKFCLAIGWLFGVVFCRFKKNSWNFNNFENIFEYMLYGLIGGLIAGIACYLLYGKSTQESSDVRSEISNTKNISINTENKSYSYIGGWLILLGVGLFISIIPPIQGIASVITVLNEFYPIDTLNLTASSKHLIILIYIILTLNVIYILLLLNLIYLFLTMKKTFKKHFLLFLAFIFLVAISENAFLQAIGHSTKEVDLAILRAIIYDIIWIPYVLFSSRVKGTFVN